MDVCRFCRYCRTCYSSGSCGIGRYDEAVFSIYSGRKMKTMSFKSGRCEGAI